MKCGPSWATLRTQTWLLCLIGLVLTGGCSTFHRDWQAAAVRSTAPDGIEGAWTGTWLSHSNGHRGSLQAIIERTPDGRYQTRFHATFWKLFSAKYKVDLKAVKDDGHYQLSGQEDLGRWLGWKLGEYRYAGTATATNFSCGYESSGDRGVFEMKRP